MDRTGHENKSFFVGPEVEHTPAYSKKTLFVIGEQSLDEITALAQEHKTPHIFMGANHSFEADTTNVSTYWDQTITALLDRGYWVTLDYPAHQHKLVLKMLNNGIWQSRIFVPLLRVEVPNVQTSSVNLTIKIDDIGFAETNPGVWCMHFHEVTDSNRFTDWIEYESDMIIDSADDQQPANVAQVPVTAPLDTSLLSSAEQVPVKNTEVETHIDLNPQDLGLDTESPSNLKPDPDEVPAKTMPVVADVAEAYAAGTTKDPLSNKAPTKTVKKSKAT